MNELRARYQETSISAPTLALHGGEIITERTERGGGRETLSGGVAVWVLLGWTLVGGFGILWVLLFMWGL